MKQQNERMKEMATEERFFSSAYHDVQQPLAAINLFIRSARNKLVGGYDATHDLEVIAETSRDILDMFKDIQDYSDLGSYVPHVSSIDTQNLLAEVCEQHPEPEAVDSEEFNRRSPSHWPIRRASESSS